MAIEIEVKSNSKQARADLDRLNSSVDKINTSTENAGKMLKRLALQAGAAFAVIGSTRAVTNITDSYRRLEARIALTTASTREQVKVFKQINAVALETRANQESLADLYSRIARATAVLGVEQKEVLKITRSISQAITISGSSAESANSAIVQLGQGLAAGALRGQELNSVMEQTPAVAQAIARGMGITIGQLRAFANEGKLSANAVVQALSSQTKSIDEEFSRIPVTFAQASLIFATGIGRIVNEVDQGLGVTTRLTTGLMSMGKSMNAAAESIGEQAVALADYFSDISREANKLFDSVKHLGRAFLLVGEVIIERTFSTSQLLVIQNMVVGVKAFGYALLHIVQPLARVANMIERAAYALETFATGFRLGPLQRSIRYLSLGFSSMFGSIMLGLISFTSSFAASFIVSSKELTTFIYGLEAGTRQVGIAFTKLGKEFGTGVGFMGLAFRGLGHLLDQGLGGVLESLSIFTNNLLVEKVLSGLIYLQYKVAQAGGKIAQVFLEGITKGLRVGEFAGTLGIFEKLGYALLKEVRKMLGMIEEVPISRLQRTLDGVAAVFEKFAKTIVGYFSWVYKEVVGNSWWIDTIDEVVAYADKLWPAAQTIEEFSNRIAQYFEDGFGDTENLLFKVIAAVEKFVYAYTNAFSTVEGIANGAVNILIVMLLTSISPVLATIYGIVGLIGIAVTSGAIDLHDLSDAAEFVDKKIRYLGSEFNFLHDSSKAFANTLQVMTDSMLFTKLLSGLKAIGTILKPLTLLLSDTFGDAVVGGMTLGLTLFLLPFKAFGIIVAAIFSTQIIEGMDSALSQFGTSSTQVFTKMAENIGFVAEALTEAFVRNLPYILSIVTEIGAGIIRGFLDSIPLIGGALASVFGYLEGLLSGLSFLLGAGVLTLMFKPSVFKSSMKALFKWFRKNAIAIQAIEWIRIKAYDPAIGWIKKKLLDLLVFSNGKVTSGFNSLLNKLIYGAGGRAAGAADAAVATGLISSVSASARTAGMGALRSGGLLKKLLVGALGFAALLGMTGAFASEAGHVVDETFFGSITGMNVAEGGLLGLSLFGTAGAAWFAAKVQMITSPVLIGLTSILKHPTFLVIAAIVAAITAVGLLAAYFFGSGDTLFKKLDDLGFQVSSFFGIADKYVSKYKQKGVLQSIMGDFDMEGLNSGRMFYDQLEDPQKINDMLGSGQISPSQFNELSKSILEIRSAQADQASNLMDTYEADSANLVYSARIEEGILTTNRILEESKADAIKRAKAAISDPSREGGARGLSTEIGFWESAGEAWDELMIATSMSIDARISGKSARTENDQENDRERRERGAFAIGPSNALHDQMDRIGRDMEYLSEASLVTVDSMLGLARQVETEAPNFLQRLLPLGDIFRELKTSILGAMTSEGFVNARRAQDSKENSINKSVAKTSGTENLALRSLQSVISQIDFNKFNEKAIEAFKEVGKDVSKLDLGFLSEEKRKEVSNLIIAYRDASEVYANSNKETANDNAVLLRAATENLEEGLESSSDKLSRKVKAMGADLSSSAFANLGREQANRIGGLYKQIAEEEAKVSGLKSGQIEKQQELNLKIQAYKDVLAGILVASTGIGVALSNSGFTSAQITNSSDAQLVAVANTANKIADMERKLSRVGTISETTAAAYRKQLKDLKAQLDIQKDQVAATRTISELTAASGVSQETLVRFSGEDLVNALAISESKRNLVLQAKELGKVDAANLATYVELVAKIYEEEVGMKGLVDSTRTQYELINGLSNISFAGGLERFYDLGPAMQAELLEASKQAKEFQAIMDEPNATAAEIQEAFQSQLLLTKQTEKLNEVMARGTEVAGAIKDTFADSVRDIADGVGGLGDVFKNVMKEIQSTLIDTAIDTLTNAVFGTDGGFEGAIQAMFAKGITPKGEESGGLFGKASSAIGGIGGVASIGEEGSDEEGLTEAATGLAGFSASIKGAVGGLADWGAGIISSILNFFGFQVAQTAATTASATTTGVTTALSAAMALATGAATALAGALSAAAATSIIPGGYTGGYVSGPGTGTSDSILARLSNGEYVMNAKAVKENGALLAAINNGDALPKFATGGLVATGPTNTASAASQRALVTAASPQSGQGQQVINLNITGDISRQTKKEVMKMLPSIAGGVNQHNRENQR